MPQTCRFSSLAGYACLVLALLLASASICWAGKGPSPENCQALGLITVDCFLCTTGETVGVVSVDAEYDPKHKDCVKKTKMARNRCIDAYNMDSSNAGCKWNFWMGLTRYSGHSPTKCTP